MLSIMIAENRLPVINPNTITLEQFNMDYAKGNMSTNSFPPYESSFRSEMESKRFSDYYGIVVATRYPRGIPATVKELGINGSYLEKRSEYFDTFYFNDTQLCELAAMNY